MKNVSGLIGLIVYVASCNTPQQSVIDAGFAKPDTVLELSENKEPNHYPFMVVTNRIKQTFKGPNKCSELEQIYSKNEFKPFFTNRDKLIQGLSLIRESKYHGLNPNEYGFDELDNLFALFDKQFKNDSLAAELDLKLTKGIRLYCHHLAMGKLNPIDYHFSWNFPQRELSFDSVLFNKLVAGEIASLELIFEPANENYKHLKTELRNRYNKNESNFSPIVYPNQVFKKGASNIYIKQIKEILKYKGWYNGKVDPVFNDSLEAALKYFQSLHSLNADGVPGKRTFAFLNWNNERYINALKVNLERLRWMPDTFDSNSIVVNIPAALLHVNSDTGLVFQTKLVVGKYKNQTPVYYSEIDYMVFNPCWTVPKSIATEKMLPKLKKDSNYLKNRNMFIGLNGIEQETTGIDFSEYNKNNFPYKIYQRNGAGNALGKVKFMFHNPYSIYLHDTPSKTLFSKDVRAYSHGCMRVQNAMAFADLLLYKLNDHSRSKQYYLKKGYPEIVNLKKRIPISVIYLTSFLNPKTGMVNYCTDIYANDLKVLVDLEKQNN